MMFEYAEPTSLAEMQERHKEIRRRLYAKPQKRAPAPKPRPKEVCSIVFFSQHDAHVIDYRMHMRAEDPQEAEEAGRIIHRRSNDFWLLVSDILSNEPEFTWEEIQGKGRSVKLVRLRDAIIHAAKRQNESRTLPRIGLWFDRDHTTILHAIRKTEEAIAVGNGVWRQTAMGQRYFMRFLNTQHYGRGARK